MTTTAMLLAADRAVARATRAALLGAATEYARMVALGRECPERLAAVEHLLQVALTSKQYARLPISFENRARALLAMAG